LSKSPQYGMVRTLEDLLKFLGSWKILHVSKNLKECRDLDFCTFSWEISQENEGKSCGYSFWHLKDLPRSQKFQKIFRGLKRSMKRPEKEKCVGFVPRVWFLKLCESWYTLKAWNGPLVFCLNCWFNIGIFLKFVFKNSL